MTLVKALNNKEDKEYYKQFCKEEADISNMVSSGRKILAQWRYFQYKAH